MSKSRLDLLSPSREKYVYFLQDLGYFCQETGVTSQRARMKLWQNLFHPHNSCQLAVKQKNFKPDFQVWLLFLAPRLHFFSKKRDFHIHNFLVPKVPSVYIGTKFTLKNHATTVHPLQCKTNFFIHLCFWGRNLHQIKKHPCWEASIYISILFVC